MTFNVFRFLISVIALSIGGYSPVAFTQTLPDLSTAKTVLFAPPFASAPPAPGLRVRQTTAGWQTTKVYHALYLPKNWKRGRKYPVIVEYAGNGNYQNKYGDVSTGSVEGSSMGYGLSKGKDFIWICMPFIENKDAVKQNATTWWGDVEETEKYLFATINELVSTAGADTANLILAGFSRGAIACNYLGLYDDRISTIWKAFFCHSHYDGVRETWPYANADKPSALQRLQRLQGRPQWISQEGSTAQTQKYLLATGIKADFTFKGIPYRNHSDQWLLKDIPESKAARAWLRRVVNSSYKLHSN